MSLRFAISSVCFVNLILFAVCSKTHAQIARYQLGKQVIAFEEAFELVCQDSTERAKPMRDLQNAVRSFFALSLPEAEKSIDLARLSLLSSASRQVLEPLAGLRLRMASRWLASDDAKLELSLVDAYERESFSLPTTLSMEVEVTPLVHTSHDAPTNGNNHTPILLQEEFSVSDLNWTGTLTLRDEGDYIVRPTFKIGMDRLELPWYIVSVTRDRDQRLEKVLAQTKQAREWKSDWFGATLKLNSSTLRSLSRNSYLETDFPAHQILVWLEKGIEQEGNASTIEAAFGNGQYWLDFSKEARSGVVRIQFPNSMNSGYKNQDQALPVIVAYHGAGGSENMFFDAYGAGRLAKLARDNGYLLITPRQPLMGALLPIDSLVDQLANIASIDRSRIIVIGHSMGAGQTISQLDRHPDIAQAAVILGGGRAVQKPDSWKGIKVYAAAGDKDFGLSGTQAFAKSLGQMEAKPELEIFENTEHLGIVQVAWDRIFDWLGQLE
jgi:predicted esterase